MEDDHESEDENDEDEYVEPSSQKSKKGTKRKQQTNAALRNKQQNRRASAPATAITAKKNANALARKPKGRQSAGDVDLLSRGDSSFSSGDGNGLLEAVKRNVALASVVSDWVSGWQHLALSL